MTSASPSNWISSEQMAKALGISKKTLMRLRTICFKEGRHYRVVNPFSLRSTYRWHQSKCQSDFDKFGK